MEYPRVIQQIHQIEITSRCNLRCKYCPYPSMAREKADMHWATFERAIYWVETFDKLGLEKELSFTGIGEATLHPEFTKMLTYAREKLPKLSIVFSTNGLPSFTDEIGHACKDLNIEVMVSMHRPEVAARTINLCRELGILKFVNNSFATESFDWAGQVEGWFVSAPNLTCEYLRSGWAVILQNGDITTCCLDAEGLGVVGTVWDEPGSLGLKPFDLCSKCHMKVP